MRFPYARASGHLLEVSLAAHVERLALLLIVGAGLLLRLWGLGDKGLGYDEAATALMARAPAAEIIAFHWRAAFEHPPLWQLTTRAWSAWFGQSEAALRLLPALAGGLAAPLAWYWLRLLWPQAAALRLLAAALIAFSPTLVIYSQEARMYSLVVLLALLSLCLLAGIVPPLALARTRAGFARGRANWTKERANWTDEVSPAHPLTRSPAHPLIDWPTLLLFVVINWLLLGYHYYSLLLVGCEALFLLLLLLRSRAWALAPWWLGAIAASLLPLGLWMVFSPGFHDTFAAITGGIGGGGGLGAGAFFDGLWRDLSFGAFRWPPATAAWGYLLLPWVLLGAGVLLAAERRTAVPWGWLVALVALLPLGLSVLFFRTLAARYILFSLPAIYALAAAGIVWLASVPARTPRAGYTPILRSPHAACGWACWLLGALGVTLAAVPALLGLGYYFGPYQKSEYREMAAFLSEHVAPDEAILLYAPRQHLLAKYYLGDERTYHTAPQVDLPAYWPVNAPPVVPEEMDGQLQALLAAHRAVWLVMTAQDEVDDGEFVPKYLTAVAYKQECWEWRDVDLCRFASSQSVPPGEVTALDLLYNGELRLQRAQAALAQDAQSTPTIYVQLDWLAEQKPSIDYRVTLRLLDAAGQIVAQRDDYPIGPLLPPTTWHAGDAKPGYMALPLPAGVAAAGHTLTVNVYDPVSGAALGEPLVIPY